MPMWEHTIQTLYTWVHVFVHTFETYHIDFGLLCHGRASLRSLAIRNGLNGFVRCFRVMFNRNCWSVSVGSARLQDAIVCEYKFFGYFLFFPSSSSSLFAVVLVCKDHTSPYYCCVARLISAKEWTERMNETLTQPNVWWLQIRKRERQR